ncbi:ParA family protein [Streptomyces sp. NPDC012888]|uniref:ParA family protein n=1 Tax=Streptomyces sp. NPDC012888 TaxID=3364855 RepID=UPI0036A1A8AA
MIALGGAGVRVVSVINYKGGVGKTTVTANIGAELAHRGKKVLLIDLDPQASLTFSLMKPEYWRKELESKRTIKRWYDSLSDGSPKSLSSLIIDAPRVGRLAGALRLIPSHLGLINVDLELATELGGGTMKQVGKKYLQIHRRLADGLAEPEFADYDFILIDCPPNFNIVTKTAIIASDHILIPARADYLSTLGIDYLQLSLRELVNDYNRFAKEFSDGDADGQVDPQVLGVVFTMMQFYGGQPISALRPYIAQTRSLGVPVFESYVRDGKTLFADAPEIGKPLVLQGGGPAGQRQVVEELERLVDEFLRRIGA